MNALIKIIFATLIVLVIVSCDKNDDDLPEELSTAIDLKIHPEFNTYVSESGNHYYTGAFESKNDTMLYRLKVENGMNYHMSCMQPSVQTSSIEMILFNQNLDTITHSSHHQDGHRILYQSNTSGDLYLKVFIKGPITESLIYNLYFEEIKSTSVDFVGYNWDCNGLWTVESEHSVALHCYNTLKYRWMRLNEDFQDSPDISFTVKSKDNTEFNSVGFVIAGSSNMLKWGDYQQELPDNGYFFNLTDEESFSVFDIHGDGISFSYGDLNIPNLNLKEGVDFRVAYYTDSHAPHYVVYINDVHVKAFSTTYLQKFYIVADDKGTGEIVIENFKIEPME